MYGIWKNRCYFRWTLLEMDTFACIVSKFSAIPWGWWLYYICTKPTRLVDFNSASSLKQQSAGRRHSTLSWLRVDKSLLLLLNDVSSVENQQTPILLSLVWPNQDSNPRSTALKVSVLTIRPLIRLKSCRNNADKLNKEKMK